MTIKINPVGFHFKLNPVKTMIADKFARKQMNPRDFLTVSEDLNVEPFNYIQGIQSTIANFAKANKLKIDISPAGNQQEFADKFNSTVLSIKVSDIKKTHPKSIIAPDFYNPTEFLVLCPSYEVSKKPFAHELYAKISELVAKVKNK